MTNDVKVNITEFKIDAETLNEEVKFEEEETESIDLTPQPKKLSMNRVLDLIMAHYHSEEEWERQLKGFVEAIEDKDIRERFMKTIEFNGNATKPLFYQWGQLV